MAAIRFVILTVSDTCYAHTNEDKSGPKLEACIKSAFPNSCIVHKEIVPDDRSIIAQFLTKWSLKDCDVILTTGGTGFSPRDVTPEATRSIIDKEAPGLSYAMISKSLSITDMAMLSRAVCGIKCETLIINLPGSVKGATECFQFVRNAIPHAVALLKGNQEVIESDHRRVNIATDPIMLRNAMEMMRANYNNTSTRLNTPAYIIETIEPSKVQLNQVAFRNRGSPYPMVEVSDALKLIFTHCPKTTSTTLFSANHCLNRVLAEDVHSKDALPPFAASIKDGYAVRVEDGVGIRRVRDAVAAGDTPTDNPLCPGEIIRISTGAAVPPGADAVVQVEDTVLVKASPDGSKELEVEIKVAPTHLQDIRPIGSDIQANSVVLCAGDTITAGHMGILAAIGTTNVQLYGQASLGILSTGNELQPTYQQLKPGHIRDSNKSALMNLLRQYGYLSVDLGIAIDDPNHVKRALTKALTLHDVVVTTGGVSMGEFDVIKQVLVEDFGATIHFGRVNMKPGKPTTFATCTFKDKFRIIFGLPGNPVSAMVTCVLFVIPTLRHFENCKQAVFPQIPVSLGVDIPLDPRPEFARIHLKNVVGENILKAYPVGNQISSRINSFIGAAALLHLPGKTPEKNVCKAGEILQAYLLESLNIEYSQ